ncbi:unnamed protein product [Schistosoma margrebowiei]|uniref:Death domain-containing protein n=1 Tax=Schistosoma margrebowiei TaxID=48269 RepID=A0AA85AMD9_9TREM|nr:unnamed protein product [Schistosoma margrebowiei]
MIFTWIEPRNHINITVIKVQSTDCSMVTINVPPELRKIEQILFASVKQNRFDLVSRIIDGHKCDINVRDSFDRTPLHLAASSGNLPMVKLLIEGRALVDPVDKFGITPLFWAVYNNYKNVAHYLLNMGAKHNRVTKQGFTILHFISESNAISILKYLHRKSLTLEYDNADNNGMTPFLIAASKGNELLMEILVKRNCNVNATDLYGRNALHFVSKNGHIDALYYLLSVELLKTKIDELDNSGCSPLHLACENNQQHCVRLLLETGANPDIETETRDCPLIECSRRGFHKCIDLLIENKASREKTSKVGDTALHVAALSNLSDTIYFLFSRKFDLCAVKEDKQTPLHLAVSQNRLEAVEALLFCGAPLDLKDKDKQTPLMIAAKSNYTALVDMIIRADRWNKTYPVNAQKLIDEILQTQQTKYVTTRILDKKQNNTHRIQKILSNDRKHLFNDNTGNHNNNNKNNDSTEDSESSRTYVGQHHDYHHHHLTTDNDANSIIPNDNDPNDVMMIEFIDPFKQLQLEENNEQINEIQLIVDHRSRTTASSESGSELSLGYEASRAWNRSDQRQYQTNHDQLNNSFSLSQISLNRDLTESNFNQEHYDNDDDYHQRKHESLNNLSCQIQGDEIYLPNGETIFRITDTLLAQSSKNMRLLNGYGLNLTHPFTFRAPCQDYADDMNVLFYEYSHRYAKTSDWKNLAKFWGFTLDDITAIEYQDIGKNSYKEHTYRLLNIWLHGINDNQSPLNELYLALTTIGRKRIVEQLRRRIKTLNKLNNKHKCKLY